MKLLFALTRLTSAGFHRKGFLKFYNFVTFLSILLYLLFKMKFKILDITTSKPLNDICFEAKK